MHADDSAWDYSPLKGPASWSKHFHDASGEQQSPINIDTTSTEFDSDLQKNSLKITWPDDGKYKLFNKGLSVAISPILDGCNPQMSTLSGGPLKYRYQFDHFHFHWGGTNNRGSEHTVDGKSYAAELHFVHWNSQKFMNMQTAASSKDGLAVLGVFLGVGSENKPLRQLTDLLARVEFKNDSVEVHNFSPKGLLPQSCSDYWTYDGSLTTPPCYESVSWIVFKEPITISPEQLQKLRETKSCPFYASPRYEAVHSSLCIRDNFRPPQPLNNRIVRSSFN